MYSQSNAKKPIKSSNKMWAFMWISMNGLILLTGNIVEARDSGDDIILTKGKLIMRGGKGKGNLILDTGSKSASHEEHHMMPMMPMMSHHFNPFSFYPMAHHGHQHHHQPAPIVHMQPVYLEDHSSMHHHQPEHHQQEHHQHHEEPHHYQHHEVEHHEMHHMPEHHKIHEMPEHHEVHHEHHEIDHHMPQHHEELHHEPVHYEHEGHHEETEGHHSGYASHPMVTAMMMHGSGLQPTYEQLATLQALQHPVLSIQHELEAQRAIEQHNLKQQDKQSNAKGSVADLKDNTSVQASTKQNSVIDPTKENPLVAMIRPLFKRNNTTNKNKKP